MDTEQQEVNVSSPAPEVARPRPRKITAGMLARDFFGRALHPRHLYRAYRLHRQRKAQRRALDDAQLALYARLFPTGFLHYGYFDDPDVRPEDLSLSDIEAAQARYAQLQIELATESDLPVLDIGCGMGGLARLLVEHGFAPTALTPDRTQVAHVETTLPHVPVIRAKFEDLPIEAHRQRYGTLFTAESLQYLKLDRALPRLAEILHPGGQWIACDFFRLSSEDRQAGHVWADFEEKLASHGWRLTYQRDITAHVLPTLRYIHMWATRFGIPLMAYGFNRLERKQSGLYHLLTDVRTHLQNVIDDNMAIIDPTHFAATKRYMLLKMERD